MINALKFVVLACAAIFFASQAYAGDLYNACVRASDWEQSGPQHAAACKCIVEKTSGNKKLEQEALSLTSMSKAERDANASPALKAIFDACSAG